MSDELEEQKQPLTPREISNANLTKNKATQFGAERANPRYTELNSNKPWSIRNSLKDFANRKIDENDDVDSMTEAQIIKRILPTKRPTLVQIGAARELARFAKGNGNTQFVTEQIDGKLAQTNINADFAAIQGMSDDELQRIADGVDTASEASSGTDGDTAES